MSAERTSSGDRNSLLQAAGLIKQLEEERQRLAEEVDRLEAALEDERTRNAAEWRNFFQDAGLKNTITGKPIQNLDDFRAWKAQFDALRHMRETSSATSSVSPNPQQQSKDTRILEKHQPPANTKPPRKKSFMASWWPAILCSSVFFLMLICVGVYSAYFSDAPVSPSSKTGSTSDASESVSHAVNYTTNLVGSVNSDFIHRTACRHAEKILEKNRVYYKTLEDASADGRVRCSECLGVSSTGTASKSSHNEIADDFTSRYLELRDQRDQNLPSLFN